MPGSVYLVRHERPLVDRGSAAATWLLDRAGHDQILALRDRLPARPVWYCSPEPKARDTARLLAVGVEPADGVHVEPDLREHERGSAWVEDFAATVQRALETPELPAVPGWEAAEACQQRVTAACARILSAHPGREVVLVGHGTAWTLLAARLTGSPPDLERWRTLRMPDVIEAPRFVRSESE